MLNQDVLYVIKNFYILHKFFNETFYKSMFISTLLFYIDTTSFEDISPQGISDDSSTGSRVHGKIKLYFEHILNS